MAMTLPDESSKSGHGRSYDYIMLLNASNIPGGKSWLPCDTCLGLDLRDSTRWSLAAKDDTSLEYSLKFICSKLRLSAQSECRLCTIVWCGLELMKSNLTLLHDLGRCQGRFIVQPNCSLEVEINSVDDSLPHRDGGSGDRYQFYTLKGNGDPRWGMFPAADDVFSEISAEGCSSRISDWVDDCENRHPDCKKGKLDDAVLPSRLLLVEPQGDASIKLVDSRDSDVAKYATLSHCWGKAKCIQTTKQTLSQRRHCIPWDTLPRTFQDAVEIVRALKVKFVWIDSLCIVQDDEADWKRESSRMAAIYSNSYLNIAATGAVDSQGGCFSLRTLRNISRTYRIESFPINPDAIDDEPIIYVRPSLEPVHHRYSTHRNRPWDLPDWKAVPLLSRAWVYQERHLSPRTVHFHPAELVLECQTSLRCECTGLDKVPASSRRKRMNFLSMTNREVFDAWIGTIEEFSRLLLTYESDRLPALIGLATVFQEHLKCAYLAGLWEIDLARGLLWDVVRDSRMLLESTPHRKRRPDVPSWTWASMVLNPGVGVMFSASEEETFEADERFEYLGTALPNSATESNSVASDGALYVRGAYKTAIAWPRQGNCIRKDLGLVFDQDIDEAVLITISETNLDVTCDMTNPSPVEAGTTVFCLLVGAMIEDVWEADREITHHCTLVLRSSASVDGAFERICILDVNEDLGIFKTALERPFKVI